MVAHHVIVRIVVLFGILAWKWKLGLISSWIISTNSRQELDFIHCMFSL